MDSGSKTTKQTVNSAPWVNQQPYINLLFSRANNLFEQQPLQQYQGATRAGFNPMQTNALNGIVNRGMAGSPLNQAASDEIQKSLSGQYLTEDAPGFQAVANRAREAADATYSGAGRYGSGYHDRAVADSVGNLAFQNYQAERDRMGNYAALAPTIAGQDFVDLDAALRAGGLYQNEAQAGLDAARARFMEQQELPWENLRRFQDFTMGNYGGTNQTISPVNQPSFLQQLFGGALTAAGTAGGLGWQPFA